MRVTASTAAALESGADTVVLGLFEDSDELPPEPLASLLESGEAGRAHGRLALAHLDGRRVLLLGLGPRDRWDGERARCAAAIALARAQEVRAQRLCWELPDGTAETAAALVEGTLLHAYRFERFRKARNGRPAVEELLVSGPGPLGPALERAVIVTEAQNRARDLGNLPANELTPAALGEYALELDGTRGVTVRVRGEEEIREAGMGAFAAVAQGSREPARLIELTYEGAGGPEAPLVALVGKAVTFDSGGLSLKPPASMHEMKFDMCGGAAVIEAVGALSRLGAPVRVLGVVGATENLPGGAAVKPGDIVTALDGTTIEVNNTDAEGRLVLGDCLTLARRAGAERIVDLATLTGAITTALGTAYAGLMSNDDDWANALLGAGARSGELLWRLPLHERYAEMIQGRYADITNRTERREAAAITAAEFLHHFASDVPWAHLDIAAVSDNLPRRYLDKGASGFGVRLLVELLAPAS